MPLLPLTSSARKFKTACLEPAECGFLLSCFNFQLSPFNFSSVRLIMDVKMAISSEDSSSSGKQANHTGGMVLHPLSKFV